MHDQSAVIATKDPVLRMFLENIHVINGRIERIYLFGSRARKTFRPDSDYDLLIVVEDKSIKDKLYDIAVDIFCKTNADISLKIIKKVDFEKLKNLPTPFIENIITEGIRIA